MAGCVINRQSLLRYENQVKQLSCSVRVPFGAMAAAAEVGKADEEAQKLERRRALKDLNRTAPDACMRESVFRLRTAYLNI